MTTPPPSGQDPTAPPPQDPTAAPPPPPPQDPYQPPPAPATGPAYDPYQQPPPAYPQPPPAYPQPPGYQVSGPPTYPISGGGQPYSPYPPAYPGPAMGYGFDPMTGQPYSDKSKIAAGLLQLLPGFFLGLGGIGRLYAGQTSLGVTQIVVSVLGWICFWCGFFLFFPFLVFIGAWLWAVVDGIILLAGRPTDGQGRPLRG